MGMTKGGIPHNMNIYENKICNKKFRFTNALWNELELNHPMSVGYLTTLIESKPFQTKEEWRDYYYNSGQERLLIAQKENIDLSSNTSKARQLNGNYGRTEEELRHKGRTLYQALQLNGNSLSITLAECLYMVKYRVMGETWNGVIMRERNTLQTLQKIFPQCTFIKVSGENDFRYAVDFEMYYQNTLLASLQVKPLSYLKGSSPEISKAKKANQAKNKNYSRVFGVDVFYVYSTNKGEILNPEILSELQTLSHRIPQAI